MRLLDPAYEAHLRSGATTLATCWRLVRRDGVVLGFTDHDRQLSFAGTDYLPAGGFEAGEDSRKLGPQVDTTEVVGILVSEAITEEDILLGRYDGATVETYRVDWRDLRHAETLLAAASTRLRPTAGELLPGQVVLFRLNGLPLPKHCGILVAPDRFIHAQERLGVIEASLGEGWRRRLAGRFEFPSIEDC